MKRAVISIFLMLAFIMPCSGAGPRTSANPSPKSKCPVCGMFVAKYPDWVCSITSKDGTVQFFDGPKDLFRYYLSPGRYGAQGRSSQFTSIMVKDYYTLEAKDGRLAYYVIGSDVMGPMGKELVPFGSRDDAQGFLKDHGGKRVLRFQEITPAVMKFLE